MGMLIALGPRVRRWAELGVAIAATMLRKPSWIATAKSVVETFGAGTERASGSARGG
jgi:hypothetical protein